MPARAPAPAPARRGRPPSPPRRSWTPTATSPTTAVSFQLADFAPPPPARLPARSPAPLGPRRLYCVSSSPGVRPRRVAAPSPVPCALCAPCRPSPDTSAAPAPRGRKFGGVPGRCPISGVRLPRARATSPLGPPRGASARAAAFVPRKGGAAPRGDTSCCQPLGRSLPGSPPRASPATQGRTGAAGARGSGGGLGRPPGWARRPAERCGFAGARAEDQRTAWPLVLCKNLGSSSSRVCGPRHWAHPSCPPVTPASWTGKRPQPVLPSLEAEPRAPGNGRALESPGAEAPRASAPGAFPVCEGTCPARPGAGGETEAADVPIAGAEWVCTRWGWGRRRASFKAPSPAAAQSRHSQTWKTSQKPARPGCGPFGAGVTRGRCQGLPGPR